MNVFGLHANQRAASEQLGNACDASSEDPSPAAQDLRNTCALIADLDENDPEDVERLQEILDAVTPEEAFSINNSIIYTSDYQTTNIYSRINALRNASPSGLDEDELDRYRQAAYSSTLDTAGSPFPAVSLRSGGGAASSDSGPRLGGFFSSQLSDGETEGSTFEQDADIGSGSFTAGVDYRFTDSVVAGIGLGVIQDTTDFSSVDGSTDTEGFNVTVFATLYEEDRAYADVVLDFGSNSHDLERGIGTTPAARVSALGSTDSTVTSFTVSGGRNFGFGAWDLGSYLRMSITKATIDGYTETASSMDAGFGSVFTFGSQSVDSTKLVIGGEASRAISTRRGVVVPTFRLEYEVENEKEKEDLSVALVTSGVTGSYRGTDRDTGYVNLGLGGSAVFAGGRSAYAFYETRLQHDLLTQSWLKLGLRLEF